MFKVIWTRGLVVVAVVGCAYVLGRIFSLSAVATPQAECSRACSNEAACAEDGKAACCRSSATACGSLTTDSEPLAAEPLVNFTRDENLSAAVAQPQPAMPAADDVIVIRTGSATVEGPAAPEPEGAEAALLALPSGGPANESATCPAFMPYIEDACPVRTAKDASVLDAVRGWLLDLAQVQRTSDDSQAENGQPQSWFDLRRYQHLFPKPNRDQGPARTKVDTMEFRPSDARHGEFTPLQF